MYIWKRTPPWGWVRSSSVVPQQPTPTNTNPQNAHYACLAADAKGNLLQPTGLHLLLDPGIASIVAVVRAVAAGYDSSAIVMEKVG